jgi:cobaltochelatase CobS
MLEASIPLDALKDAMLMHWPQQARKDLGVKPFDFQSFRKSDREPDKHAVFPYVMALHEAGVPIFLTGPKGTGKTTIAYQLTETVFGKGTDRFGVVSMTSGTSPSAFNGRPRIAGKDTSALIMAKLAAGVDAKEVLEFALREHQLSDVIQSQWERVYSGGGGFLFDELDAADENLLLLVNTALSNGYFSNTASGEIVYQSEEFIPIAAGNTIGVGAQRGYTGRNRLDDATLDRWNMGRVRVTLDPRIEDMICSGYEKKIGA